ncbi:MAG TPA: NADP-dependent oxidoreductase [Steroidobacteraceae bacterium]|nr:NADP-dependent oxidoreductase [Steroidobacteraceae bacterium]
MTRLLAALLSFQLVSLLSAAESAAPTDMRAVVMHGYGGAEALTLDRVPIPEPAEGQVRIRVYAAGVNPIDWKLRSSLGQHFNSRGLPRILGFDVAGTVDGVGAGVTRWKVGDAVIAALQRAPQGGYAEYTVVSADDVASKPKSMSFEEAAGLPTAVTTVWPFLLGAGDLKPGQRLLIQGAAGGVGSVAVQVAKSRGVHVIGTASANNADYLRSIGADEVIDYRSERFEDRVKGADIVFDTVGGETLDRSYAVLRAGGTLITIVGRPSEEKCRAAAIRCPALSRDGMTFGEMLAQAVALVDQGRLKVNVERVFPLEEAFAAQELNRAGHTRGKIILRVRS